MLFAVLGFFMVAVIVFSTLLVRVRTVDRNVRELVAQRAAESARGRELDELRQENLVMRNFILDVVENEASVMNAHTPEERARCHISRALRRRELFGEAVVIVDKSAAPVVHVSNLVG